MWRVMRVGSESGSAGPGRGACAALPSTLQVRALLPDDLGFYRHLYTCPEVMRHLGGPLSPDQAQAGFTRVLEACRVRPARAHYWALERARVPVGLLALTMAPGARSAEAGIMLAAHRHASGDGVHGMAWLSAAAWRLPSLAEVRVVIGPHNRQALRIARSLGFSRQQADHGTQVWVLQRPAPAPVPLDVPPAVAGHLSLA